MSTAQQTTQDSRDFVKAAQNEALSQALTDAGFGIQLISAGAQADLMEKSAGASVKKAAEPPAGPAACTAPPQEPHSAPQRADEPAEGKSPASPVETPQRAFEGEKAATATTAPSKENTASEPVKQHLPVEPAKKFDTLPVDASPKTEQPAAENEQADELPVRGNVTELPVQHTEESEPAAEPLQPEDGAAGAVLAWCRLSARFSHKLAQRSRQRFPQLSGWCNLTCFRHFTRLWVPYRLSAMPSCLQSRPSHQG